mgnify:CR=1 FL=1
MDKNLINKIKNEKINYIVEWWEEDSLDIDSNQHILFSLENEDIDIIVTEKNIDEINLIPDVIIDFSIPEATFSILNFAKKNKIPTVIATTRIF